MDQRGAGRSRPVAEVRENTTQLLVIDIETLRTKLAIQKWDVVFGGSWGSTLSLAYAQAHPTIVRTLVLRGIFLGMEWEFDWTLRGGGASTIFPDRWADFVGYLPEDKRSNPMKAYHELLMSQDRATSLEAAWHWNRWELSVSTLTLAEDAYAKLEDEEWCLQHARIEVHYFVNGNFLAGNKAILRPENIERIKNIPSKCLYNLQRYVSMTSPIQAYIVQGRYDVVCPPRAAWSLHQALPRSELYWTPNAGHSALVSLLMKTLVITC